MERTFSDVGAHQLDGRLLAGQVHHGALLAGHEGAQLQAVVDGEQPLVRTQNHREGAVHERARVHAAQRRFEGGARPRPCASISSHAGAAMMCAAISCESPWRRAQQVEQVGDDLGVGLQRAVVAELLDVAAVRVVAGNLAVVHDRPVQQRERMRAAPPAGRVGGKASVRRPQPRPRSRQMR